MEGPDDSKVYKRFLDDHTCRVIIAHGKQNAIDAWEQLGGVQAKDVIVIADSDFDRLRDIARKSVNFLFTDFHDLECMIFASAALDNYLDEFASSEKVKSFCEACRTTVREHILQCSSPIGYLRFISEILHLKLTFEGLKYDKFIDKKEVKINVSKMIRKVMELSSNSSMDDQQLEAELVSLKSKGYDLWQICCGKDMIGVLSIAMRRAIATRKESECLAEDIAATLRLAFDFTMFTQTRLYEEILQWQKETGRSILHV